MDCYAAPIRYVMEIPVPPNTPVFAMSRVVDWSAHIIEQIDNNRRFRPNSRYVGTTGLTFELLGRRG